MIALRGCAHAPAEKWIWTELAQYKVNIIAEDALTERKYYASKSTFLCFDFMEGSCSCSLMHQQNPF